MTHSHFTIESSFENRKILSESDLRKNPWSCHPIEHQMSAVYNIIHGLAIVTPRWMEFVLDENNAEKFCRFGKLSLQQI